MFSCPVQRQVQDLDSVNGALSKAKSQLQMQVDDYKTKLEEETRVSSNCITVSMSSKNVLQNLNGIYTGRYGIDYHIAKHLPALPIRKKRYPQA